MSEFEFNEYCCFLKIDEEKPSFIRPEDIHELTASQKSSMFGQAFLKYQARRPESQAILERLQQFSPSTASCFGSKVGRSSDLTFRLVSQTGSPMSAIRPSYVCLSYRWASAAEVPTHHGRNLPVSPLLWTAALRELQSSDEGIWVDQLCINQSDKAEKTLSVGLMDMIYEESRCVVVLLQDVEITREERDWLESLMPEYLAGLDESMFAFSDKHKTTAVAYMETNPIFWTVYCKLMASEYFQRAWCSHEFRVASAHILIVPCAEQDTVWRLNGNFLFEMLVLHIRYSEAPAGLDLEKGVNARRTIWYGLAASLHGMLGSQQHVQGMLAANFDSICKYAAGGDDDPALSNRQRIQTAVRDKVAIALNFTGSNIVLLPESDASLTEKDDDPVVEYTQKVQLLSLAMNEPFVLCCGGSSLPRPSSGESYSWLRNPRALEEPLNFSVESNLMTAAKCGIRLCPDEVDRYIELQLPLCSPRVRVSAACWIALAKNVTAEMLLIGKGEQMLSGRLGIDWEPFLKTDTAAVLFYQTFACTLQLGIEWVLECSPIQLWQTMDEYKMPFAALATLKANRDMFLNLAPAPDTAPELIGLVIEQLPDLIRNNPNYFLATDLTMRLTSLLIYKSQIGGSRVRPETLKPYRPFVVSLDSGISYNHLIFRHVDEFRAPNVLRPLAVPSVLLADKFHLLSRVWTVDWAVIDGEQQLSLLGRCPIFGPSLCVRAGPQFTKIYGPPKDPSQLLHRGLSQSVWPEEMNDGKTLSTGESNS